MKSQKILTDGAVFTFKRKSFKFEVRHDEDMGAPWEEHDGHGIVSEYTTRAKQPGERVLASDHGSYRYYDIAATVKLARKDGWGIGDAEEKALASQLGHKPTKGEIVAETVERDYRHMKAWCSDEWTWVYVLVTLLKKDADAEGGYFETKHTASLGGIESDSGAYLSEVGYELADEILNGRMEK